MIFALVAYLIFAVCLLVSIVVDQRNWLWFRVAVLAFLTFVLVI